MRQRRSATARSMFRRSSTARSPSPTPIRRPRDARFFMRCKGEAELVCIEPARIHDVWPHVRPLLEQACRRTALNAFAAFEADILAGRSLAWIAWNGNAIEAAAATTLINSDLGKV